MIYLIWKTVRLYLNVEMFFNIKFIDKFTYSYTNIILAF